MDGVGGLGHESHSAVRGVKTLDGGILIPYHHHSHLAVLHALLAADDDEIAVVDADGVHAVPRDPQGEILCSVVQVGESIAFDVLFGVDGKPGGDPAQDGDALHRRDIQWDDVSCNRIKSLTNRKRKGGERGGYAADIMVNFGFDKLLQDWAWGWAFAHSLADRDQR